jgi:hypothetical protein
MSNLAEAKKSLVETSQLEAIINPQPKQKRIKLPLARDIHMIERILEEKLNAKEKTVKEDILKTTKAEWDTEINQIHAKAIQLRKEINTLANAIETKSKSAVKLNMDGYDNYFGDLPENITKALEIDVFEIAEENMPIIVALKKKIDERVLDIKLGILPITEVKNLLDEIANIK